MEHGGEREALDVDMPDSFLGWRWHMHRGSGCASGKQNMYSGRNGSKKQEVDTVVATADVFVVTLFASLCRVCVSANSSNNTQRKITLPKLTFVQIW